MKNVSLLDCTLRDGGRIIDCHFPDREIKDISTRLKDAKIDIIEIGFLRDDRKVEYKGNSTFFTNVEQMIPFVGDKRTGTMYTAFIDFGMFNLHSLSACDGRSIDAIRFGFTKKDFDNNREEVIEWCKFIKEKGYKLFVQGVNSLNYSDKDFLELIELVNYIHPYSFGIVDTYGAMYIDDVTRMYGLIDHNLESDICVDFHSHNNYQLSFGLAQEVIRLSKGSRRIIIDATLAGMGKVAGNLCTELMAEYMVRKLNYDYEIEDILDIIDDYIHNYMMDYQWGYSIPAMMAGIYKSHPNNVIYLTEKFRLDTKDIGNILSMISPDMRQKYDYDNIEKMYIEYSSDKVDDKETIKELKQKIAGKEVVVLAPGNSLNIYRKKIDNFIVDRSAIVISVNFIADYMAAYAFYGNAKRYKKDIEKRQGRNVIRSSNIKSTNDDIVVNYHRLLSKGYRLFDNSTIMLLNLLRSVEPKNIYLAGFDGFRDSDDVFYMNSDYQDDQRRKAHMVDNEEISKMLKEIIEKLEGKCKVDFLTPSVYYDGDVLL